MVIPITEPAVGYGAAGGLTFISTPLSEAQAGFGRPNITIVGGLGTESNWGQAFVVLLSLDHYAESSTARNGGNGVYRSLALFWTEVDCDEVYVISKRGLLRLARSRPRNICRHRHTLIRK